MMNTNSKIRNSWRHALLAGLIAGMTGCAITPATNVLQPMSARPAHPASAETGGIFKVTYSTQANRYTPLFEDRRARYVGDIVIVTLAERTTASKKSNSTVDRTGNTQFSTPTPLAITGMPLPANFMKMDMEVGSENKFAGGGTSASNNVFTGTIAVTVIEVLSNGNLLVSGEKQIGINQGQEFIRFSGVVNPINIGNNSTISSTQVADARIEYRGNGYVDEAQTMGWFSRGLMSILPF